MSPKNYGMCLSCGDHSWLWSGTADRAVCGPCALVERVGPMRPYTGVVTERPKLRPPETRESLARRAGLVFARGETLLKSASFERKAFDILYAAYCKVDGMGEDAMRRRDRLYKAGQYCGVRCENMARLASKCFQRSELLHRRAVVASMSRDGTEQEEVQ